VPLIPDPADKIAVVTGGSKGIGEAITAGLARKPGFATIIFTATDETNGQAVLKEFHAKGLTNVAFHQLNQTDDVSIAKFTTWLFATYPRVDVLVNNGGVLLDGGVPLTLTDIDAVQASLNCNTLGPLKLIKAILPKMREHKFGRIVNMSSGMGQLTYMGGSAIGYRMSKTALNVVTRVASEETKNENILVNSMCPGLVKTAMVKFSGGVTPEAASETALWLATLPSDGPRGGFFRRLETFAW